MQKQVKIKKRNLTRTEIKTALFCAAFLCFHLVEGQAAIDTKRVALSFEVKPMTKIKVTSASGGLSAVRLGPLMPRTGSAETSLQVSVYSNENKTYRIFLENDRPQNGEGDILPAEEILYSVSSGTRGGQSLAPGVQSLLPGRKPIFNSISSGESDEFFIHFTMPNRNMIDAGTYFDMLKIVVE